jgi:hypothetical protein
METSSPPHTAIDLATPLYYQLVYTLTDLLPPPLDDTPAGLRARNLAAIAKVAALLPVNANEADLAAQCIAARAQAEDLLRLLRQHAGDIGLVIRLNAQYASMLRTSLSLHGRLMRVQAQRQKRQATDGAASQDAWALHIAERSMVGVVDPAAGPPQPAWPEAGVAPGGVVSAGVAPASVARMAPATTPPTRPEPAPAATPPTRPEAAPAACADPRPKKPVSHKGTNSQDTAFETWLTEQMRQMREATAKSPSASRSPPANIGKNPPTADYNRPINGETASI